MDLAEAVTHRLPERGQVSGVGRIVGEAGEMDAGELPQRLQQVPGANLVAPVRRKRDAMGKEEHVIHPSPRAIGGPRRLASRSGSFCQAATLSLYRGLVGFIWRGAAPSAVRTP